MSVGTRAEWYGADEDEWDGADEMRRAAKTDRLRNYPPAEDHVFD